MAVEHPGDLFDRSDEWGSLADWATDAKTGVHVAVVWGRRRQGKSYLLRRWCAATGGFYYQAVEQTTSQSLDELGARVGSHLGVGRLAFEDWDDALGALARLGGSAGPGPAVAVIDEFPYLRREAPELPSMIQRMVDASVDRRRPPVRLVLCGSALSVMAELLAPRSPLHGRIGLQLLVRPFDARTAAAFWGVEDPKLAFQVFAVVGGTPAYRDLSRSRPSSLRDFDRWVVDDVVNPASALYRDDEVLLADDLEGSNRTIYLAILSAVAAGERSQSKIAAALGRSVNSLQFALGNLLRAGLLTKDEDAIRQRRPLYSIADPLLRFHRAVRDPDAPRFEDGDRRAAWQDAAVRFRSAVLGPAWELVVRDHLRQHGAELLGAPLRNVGRTAVSDPHRRIEQEVDVVALGAGSGPKRKVVRALGEAKLRELGVGDLRRLEALAGRLAGPSVRVASPLYILASVAGFSKELARESRGRQDLKLLSLSDVYGR